MRDEQSRHVDTEMRKLGVIWLANKLCTEHGVTFYDTFVLKRRLPASTACRHHFWALLRWSTALSYPEIARITGQDHTTVLMAVRNWGLKLQVGPTHGIP